MRRSVLLGLGVVSAGVLGFAGISGASTGHRDDPLPVPSATVSSDTSTGPSAGPSPSTDCTWHSDDGSGHDCADDHGHDDDGYGDDHGRGDDSGGDHDDGSGHRS